MDSAATLHGLAQRLPAQEVVALPKNVPLPKAFAGEWRSVRVAARPSEYRGVAGLGQWLELGAHGADVASVMSLLKSQSAAMRQRAGYLFSTVLFNEKAVEVLRAFPLRQPVWFGPRVTGGHCDGNCMVNDTLLRDHLSIGVGA